MLTYHNGHDPHEHTYLAPSIGIPRSAILFPYEIERERLSAYSSMIIFCDVMITFTTIAVLSSAYDQDAGVFQSPVNDRTLLPTA